VADLSVGRPSGSPASTWSEAREKAHRQDCLCHEERSWKRACHGGSVTGGAGAVQDDLYGFVVSAFCVANLAQGAEELSGDVGEDPGALGGDAIADEEKQEPGQELVDFIGGVEFGDLIEKVGGKVVGVLLVLAEAGVTEAESGVGIADGELPRAACTGALLATDGALRPAPLAMAPFPPRRALGKLGRGDRQVMRKKRVK
jgi:hypothetical protein